MCYITNYKGVIILKKVLFISIFLLIVVKLPQFVFAGNTITVGENKQFANIIDAYNAALPNDTIIIFPGEYFIPYNKEEKSFLTIKKDGITLKGVDKYGNEIKSSDYCEVIISPERYTGVVQAQALMYVKAHNIQIEGIRFVNYIKNMPVTKWAGMGVSSGGSNRIRNEQSNNYYTETTYEAIEDTGGSLIAADRSIYSLLDVSELDKIDKRVKIIDLDETNASLQTIQIKNDHQESNSFILSAIQLDSNLSYSDKIFSLETDYGIIEIPGNIIKYIDNFYEKSESEDDDEHDTSIQALYGDKLGLRFTAKKIEFDTIISDISLKGNLAAPIVSFESAVQTYATMKQIYQFKNTIRKYVPLYDNVNPNNLMVYFINSSHKILEADYKLITKNNKTYVEISNNLSGTIVVFTSSTGFIDVSRDFWAYEAIKNLTDKGIVNGRGNGMFDPNAKVNRAEFIAMLVKAISISDNKNDTMYEDVISDAWYYEYITKAKSINILDNLITNENKKFYPFAGLIREEMASILAAYAKFKNLSINNKINIRQFNDFELIDPHYANDVRSTVNAGFMQGTPDKLFEPKSTVTRAQAAYVIWNLIK